MPSLPIDGTREPTLPLNKLWKLWKKYWPTTRATGEGWSLGRSIKLNRRLRREASNIRTDALKKMKFHNRHVLESAPKIRALESKLKEIENQVKIWTNKKMKIPEQQFEIWKRHVDKLIAERDKVRNELEKLRAFSQAHDRQYQSQQRRFQQAGSYLQQLKRGEGHIPADPPPFQDS